MEVGNSSALVLGEVLIVTTSITVRICVRHGSSSVEGLVEIANVMDDKT